MTLGAGWVSSSICPSSISIPRIFQHLGYCSSRLLNFTRLPNFFDFMAFPLYQSWSVKFRCWISSPLGLTKLLRSLNSESPFSIPIALLFSPKLTCHNLPDLPSDAPLSSTFHCSAPPIWLSSSWLHRTPPSLRVQGPRLCTALASCLAFLTLLCFALSTVSISSQRSLGLSLKHTLSILGPEMKEANGRGLFLC